MYLTFGSIGRVAGTIGNVKGKTWEAEIALST